MHYNYRAQFQWPTMLVFASLDHSLYPKPIPSNIKFFIDHPFALHTFIWSLVLDAAHMWMSILRTNSGHSHRFKVCNNYFTFSIGERCTQTKAQRTSWMINHVFKNRAPSETRICTWNSMCNVLTDKYLKIVFDSFPHDRVSSYCLSVSVISAFMAMVIIIVLLEFSPIFYV